MYQVYRTVALLPRDEMEVILEKKGGLEVKCEFCKRSYRLQVREAFDLDAYLLRLDSSGEVLPAKIWPWLKDRVSAEAASRGLSAQIPAAAPTNKRIAGLMAGGEAFLKRVAEQKARQS